MFKENIGLWAARNAGVAAVEAEFVSFVDSDDILLPTHLQEHRDSFAEGFDAVATNYLDWIPENGLTRNDPRRFPSKGKLDEKIIAGNFMASFSSIRCCVLDDVGGFRPEVTEDWDLWIRFFRKGYSVVKTDAPTYLYRWRKGSLSRLPDAFVRDWKTLNLARSEVMTTLHKRLVEKSMKKLMLIAFINGSDYSPVASERVSQECLRSTRLLDQLLCWANLIIPKKVRKVSCTLLRQYKAGNKRKWKFARVIDCERKAN